MAERVVLYWRDIPAQVIVKAGRRAAKRQLGDRFQQAIDRAAMLGGAAETDAYLAEWRRGEPEACGDDIESEADSAVVAIEAAYPPERLRLLARAGGRAIAGDA
jgi:hypothetical protein